VTIAMTAPRPTLRTPARSVALDRLRGLAISLMILDHLLLVAAAPGWWRDTITRAAMPLFFVVAGHLLHRLSWRHLFVAGIGLVLPVVTFVEDPNVLLIYALAAPAVVIARRYALGLPLLLVAAVTVCANNVPTIGTSYNPAALLALLCIGAGLDRSLFAHARRLPAALGHLGRYPLTVYVGHVLLLTAIARVL
jgi:surface polysaccharide O-acyltransferase-like enzyme